jgi:hypothetical protein
MSLDYFPVPHFPVGPFPAISRQDASAEGEMPVFRAMRHVHHSAEEMFDLVADVEPDGHFNRALTAAATLGSICNMSLQAGLWRC